MLKKHRKFLAILLCMVMCLSLLPAAAFAEEDPEEDIVVEEEPVTEELVVAEEPAEEDDLVIEEAADSFENTNRTGDDDTLLEELEAAIADENVHDFDLSNLGEFVISRDLDVYGGMALNTIGTTVVIPEGVTVTVRDYFGLENLQLDGEMTLEEGHVSVFWELVLNGQMTLIRSSADLPAEAFSDAVFDRVDLSEDGYISLQYAAVESEEEILSAMEAAQALPERYDGCVQVLFPWTLSRDLTLDEKVGLVLEGAWNQGSLEIPADTSLTVDSYLVSVGSPVRVHGMLVNNRELFLDADDGAENPSVGSLELDRGSYSGPGSIYVLSTENPEDYLQGLDLSAFESHIEDEIWTVYTNDNAVFEDFKKACSEASELNPIHYTRLSDRGAFTIPESITIPKGLSVDVWNTVITVPSGVTLTVCGEFTLGDLVVAEGGEVVLEEECNLWIDNSLKLEGSILIANNTWVNIPADSWDQSMTEHLTFGGKDAGVILRIPARSEEDILSAPEQYPILPHVRPSIGVEFAWRLSDDFAFPEGVEIHINGEQGGSLTVPRSLRFENGGGYLGLHGGATMTVAGTLVNNGFVDVQREDNQASKIVMDGGAYLGNGTICVRDAADEEEAAGYLGGLTELGTFRVEEQEDGIYFQLREPDWTFAHLQEVCAETYKEGDDNYREIPNEGPLTIEDNLTIPENLILNKPGGAIVVPEGKTLTIIGTLHCNGLVADGSVILKDGGYLNVYGSQLEGKGTITVQSDSHMDVNTEAWKGGEWVSHILFEGDRSYGTVWYDVWKVEDALAAVADTPVLGDHMGRSLNIHFDWTLEKNLTIPDEMWVEIRGKDGAALTIPAGVTLTMNNALRAQGADVSVLGTLVNEGRVEIYWDDEHKRLGSLCIESGGRYDGEGCIWVDAKENAEACLVGFREQQPNLYNELMAGKEVTDDGTVFTRNHNADPVAAFVKRAYSLILGREADQGGLDYWVKGLNDKTLKGGDIVSQFMNSDEYVLANHPNADAVTAVYKTMLDRDPDASGLAYWVGLLDQLCSYNKIISGFCDSPEFKGVCEQYGIEPGTVATEPRDVNPNVTAFVARFYECALGRKFDNKGLNYWADQLLSHAATPYEAAHGFVFSEECVNRGLNNTEFVTMLYNLYMDREPEAGGLTYWVGQLDNNSVTREAVEVGFAQSPEFQNIVKSYGL